MTPRPWRRSFRLAGGALARAAPAWGAVGATVTAGAILLGAAAVGEQRAAFASFTNGAAWARPALDLAAPLLGALLGATALPDAARLPLLRARDGVGPARAALATLVGRALAGVAGVLLGILVAVAVLSLAESDVSYAAVAALATGQALVLLAFASLGLLAAALAGSARVGGALAAAALLVVALGPVWDVAVFAAAFKTVGYAGLQRGEMPMWVLAAQAFNPFTAYKALIVTWERGFANVIENAALGGEMPWFVTPWTFAGLLGAWVVGSAAGALGVLHWRAARAGRVARWRWAGP